MTTLKLSKDDLLSRLVASTGFKKKDCEIFTSHISEILLTALTEKKEVSLGSLGTFKYKQSKPRTCKVISTGKTINVPAKGGLTFKTSKKAKETLSNIL